jgi:hypothetical protein
MSSGLFPKISSRHSTQAASDACVTTAYQELVQVVVRLLLDVRRPPVVQQVVRLHYVLLRECHHPLVFINLAHALNLTTLRIYQFLRTSRLASKDQNLEFGNRFHQFDHNTFRKRKSLSNIRKVL